MTEPKIHRFSSTGEAYDASQTHDEIADGDVLFVEPEGVVGILVEAWPVAVIISNPLGDPGQFHLGGEPLDAVLGEKYAGSLKLARTLFP